MMKTIDWGKVLTSKTLWLNVAAFLALIIDYLSQGANPNLYWIGLVQAGLNFLNRFLTNDSLIKK
jgi:hypothetical protein